MSYEEIINEIYADKEKAIKLFNKYDLEHVIRRAIEVVKSKTAIDSPQPIRIGGMSALLLREVNTRLRNVPDQIEKRDLEVLISDIAFYLLNKVIRATKGDHVELLEEVKESLKDTCSSDGYDFNELVHFLNLNRLIELASTLRQKVNTKKATIEPHYEWLGKDYELDELSRTLKSANVIKSVKAFKSLFEYTPQTGIEFNAEKVEHVVVLFDLLKERQLITTKGSRGHLHPLKVYSVDFEKGVFVKKEPKSINYALRKNQSKWSKLRIECGKWLGHIRQPLLTLS